MSNKKRISKRVRQLERLVFIRFIQQLDICGKRAEEAGEKLAKMLNGISDNTEALKRRVQVFNDYGLGYEFKFQEKDPELEAFIMDIRILTGFDEKNVKNTCVAIPKQYWKTCKGLLMVGFSLEDAVEEIVKTYRL